jgi:hypothetical protein
MSHEEPILQVRSEQVVRSRVVLPELGEPVRVVQWKKEVGVR